jgi:hypothetical protein
MFDLVYSQQAFGVDGIAEDTLAVGGARIGGSGFEPGFSENAWWIETIPQNIGDTLCIDTVTTYPPANNWYWSSTSGGFPPEWIGRRNYFVADPEEVLICGDVNCDMGVNILDITFLIAYLYMDGPEPISLSIADVNSDGPVNILDINYLIAYLYMGGPEPVCP